MLNPDRFSGILFRSRRFSLQALAASAGIVALALAICALVHRAPYATASDSVGPLAANVVRSAVDFNWRQSPSSLLNSPGKNSVTLEPCPPGVIAAEPWYYVYISGTGTAEAVRVTGGSCKGDGRPGTLEFTTTNAHPSGYVVSSASGGVQEASIAARFVPTNPPGTAQAGRVVVPPGEYDVFAPISIRATNQTVDFAGSTLNCYTVNDPCIFVGDHASSGAFENITLIGPRGRPMIVAGTKPFIEVNAEQTRIFNVSSRWPPRGGSFGSYVQVDDDQAFLLDGMDTQIGGSAVTCNPTYCGAFVTAPGPFNHWSAVGWLKHLNISLQCAAKGVEWISGNGLKISDSVIQGWSVFGVRVSNQRGGYAGLITDNVYFEASPSCKQFSPYGNVGSAAIIAEGIQVKIMGISANGPNGTFPNWGGESGTHDRLYWVVPVHVKFGDGVPLPAGHAITSGSGSITGTFPKIAGASSYKILKIDWDRGTLPVPYPQGTGRYLLTTVQQSSCATLTCQFTDNGGPLSSYTNAGENFSANLYMPRLDFWPGSIVLSPAGDMTTANYSMQPLPLQADVVGAGGIVTTLPAWAVAAEANTLAWASPGIPPAAANVEALHTNGIGALPGATILKAANLTNTPSGHKGRLNFGYAGQTRGFTPVITLGDSNWGKTWAASDHRPPSDVNDLDVGYEGDIDTFYSRAQKEVREYIGKFPDGNPQERLTATAKTFNVPVTINGNLTVTGKCVGCGGDPVGGSSSNGASTRWMVSLTGQKAAIATTDLCGPSACGPGQYRVSYYLDSTTACGSPGKAAAALTIGWKDETSARKIQVPLSGAGISGGNNLSLGGTGNFGSGNVSLWSAGNAAITYSTTFSACAAGVGSYSVRIALERVQ
jgi:hypothetical protein